MIKRIILLVLLIMVLAFLNYGVRMTAQQKLMNPVISDLNHSQLLVTDNTNDSIFVYSLNNLKVIKK
jgi:hypothetical protein